MLDLPVLNAPPAVRRLTLADQVRDQIREAIVAGDLAQGGPIGEPALAARFGVSRAPVREALIALEREGLVAFDERGRTRVLALTPTVFEELVAVRVALEGAAARLAAARGGSRLKTALRENVAAQAAAATYRELTRLDVAFHEIIVRAADNGRLHAAWLTARSVFEFWLSAAFRDTDLAVEPRELVVKSHQKLLAAVTSGDGDRAEKAAGVHISSWRSYLPERCLSAEGSKS